jgi:thioredoxin 1
MIEINNDNFDQEVLQSDKPVLIDFWGPRCSPCLALLPKVEELAKKYEGKVKFCKIDTNANRRLAISQKVMGLPTVILYKNGEKVEELVRDVTVDDIERMILENI